MEYTHRTHNTLAEEIRLTSISILNRHLAAAIDLHAQVKQAHWNVRGPGFMAVHELFDDVSEEVEDYSDTIAERCAALGGTAEGTVRVAAERSFLVPYPLGIADVNAHVFAVAAALAAFSESARAAIDATDEAGDKATADLFTAMVREIDKQVWFVESHQAGAASRPGQP